MLTTRISSYLSDYLSFPDIEMTIESNGVDFISYSSNLKGNYLIFDYGKMLNFENIIKKVEEICLLVKKDTNIKIMIMYPEVLKLKGDETTKELTNNFDKFKFRVFSEIQSKMKGNNNLREYWMKISLIHIPIKKNLFPYYFGEY